MWDARLCSRELPAAPTACVPRFEGLRAATAPRRQQPGERQHLRGQGHADTRDGRAAAGADSSAVLDAPTGQGRPRPPLCAPARGNQRCLQPPPASHAFFLLKKKINTGGFTIPLGWFAAAKVFFYPPCPCKMLELAPSARSVPPRRKAAAGAPCRGSSRGSVTHGGGRARDRLGVPYLAPWVLRLPTDCTERLPATLGLAGEDQPADDPSQDLMLSAGSRLSVEPTLEQASLQGEMTPR